MKFVLQIFLFFIAHDALCQSTRNFLEYYKLINEGKDRFDSMDYNKAAIFYKTAFAKVDTPLPRDLIKAAIIDIYRNNEKSAIIYLNRAASLGLIANDSILKKIPTSQIQLGPLLKSKQEAFLRTCNQFYIGILDSLYSADQRVRQHMPRAAYGAVDSSNTFTLLGLISKFGFPSFKNVGPEAADKAVLIFTHADFDRNNLLLGNILLNAVKHGELLPRTYAQIMDRRCNFSGRSFEFYEIPFGYDELSKPKKDSVTMRRNAVGLRSVEKDLEYKFSANGNLSTRNKD